MEFMPEHAPLVVLAFLGTVFLLGLSALALLISLLFKKKWIGISAAAFATLVASAYILVLLAVSLTSHQKVLAPGEKKYFCEIDCHLAYSIEKVEEAPALGDESRSARADRRFVIVRLKTWFDPTTISPTRGDGLLPPGERRTVLVDEKGREFPSSPQAQSELARLRGATTPLDKPLRPGESYFTDLVFDLPSDVRNPRLLVGDQFFVDHFLIGHEDSFLHPKIYLALNGTSTVASAGRIP